MGILDIVQARSGVQPQAVSQPMLQPQGPGILGRVTRPGMVRETDYEGERDIWDVTGGAFLYGGAETGATLAGYAQRWAPSTEWIGDVKTSLVDYTVNHPEYSPEQVNSAWDLVTNPSALSSRVFGGAPYVLATAGAAAVPYVGLPLAAGMTYAIEGQQAYESAKQFGATEDEATRAGQITGAINSVIELAEIGNLYKFARGGKAILAKKAIERAGIVSKGLQLTGHAAKHVAVEAVEEMLQGTTEELTALGVYGKPIQKGFLDRRLQEAVGAAALSGVFGIGGSAVGAIGQTGEEMEPGDQPQATADAFTREDLFKKFKDTWGLDDKQAMTAVQYTDQVAHQYAKRHGGSPEQYYGKFFAHALDGELGGITLMQDTKVVEGFYSKLQSVLLNGTVPEDEISPEQMLTTLKNQGVKDEELRWTGIHRFLKGLEKVKAQSLREFLDNGSTLLVEQTKGYEAAAEVQRTLFQAREASNLVGKELEKVQRKLQTAKPEQQQELLAQRDELTEQHMQLQTKVVDALKDMDGARGMLRAYRTPGESSDYREVLLRMPELMDPESGETVKASAKDPHYVEPNVLVHLRFDTRTIDGKKTMWVQEVQSSVHQKGRKEGYVTPAMRRQSQARMESLWQRKRELMREAGELLARPNLEEVDEQLSANKRQQEAVSTQIEDIKQTLKDTPPEMPFSKTWVKLALRKLMMHAVESGHDAIAFANGELTNELYPKQTEEQKENKRIFYDNILMGELRDELRKLDKSASLRQVELPVYEQAKTLAKLDGPIDLTEEQVQKLAERYDQIAEMPDEEQSPQENQSYATVSEFLSFLHGQLVDGVSPYQAVEAATEATRLLEDKMARAIVEEIIGVPFQQETPPPPRVNQLLLTPKLRAGIANGLPLFQSAKGSVTFLANGKAVLNALENPDISTAMHELFHVFRRHMDAEDLRLLGIEVGVENGVWEVEHEEAAARAFERYLREGKAPTAELYGVFNRFREWLKGIYRVIKGSDIDVKINDRMRMLFDHLVAEDSRDIHAKRAEIDFLTYELDRLDQSEDESETENAERLADAFEEQKHSSRAYQMEIEKEELQYAHKEADVRMIASGEGKVTLYHGTTVSAAEQIIRGNAALFQSGEAAAQEIARMYGIPWAEFKHQISVDAGYGAETSKLSTGTFNVAKRWAGHPMGEVERNLNTSARLYLESKRAKQSLDQLYDKAKAIADQTGVKFTFDNAADILKLPTRIPNDYRGAVVAIDVDVRNLPEHLRKSAARHLEAVDKVEGGMAAVLATWNDEFKDFKVDPSKLIDPRIVERYDLKPPVPEQPIVQKARTDDDRAKMSLSEEALDVMAAGMYKGDVAKTSLKEMLQNSVDATRELGDQGRIVAELDTKARRIVMSDNGHGMLPEVFYKQLVDVGGTKKPPGASGGMGMAKVAILGNSGSNLVSTTERVLKPRSVSASLIRQWASRNISHRDELMEDPSVGVKSPTAPYAAVGMIFSHFEQQTGSQAQGLQKLVEYMEESGLLTMDELFDLKRTFFSSEETATAGGTPPIFVQSVAQDAEGRKIETTMTGTSKEWLSTGLKIESREVDASTPTGTKFHIYWTPKAEVGDYAAQQFAQQFQNRTKLPQKIKIRVNDYDITKSDDSNRYNAAANELLATEVAEGGNLDFWISKQFTEPYQVKIGILNNGLYQFDLVMEAVEGVKYPAEILVDVKSTVPVTSSKYPFGINREVLSPVIEETIKSFVRKRIAEASAKKDRDIYVKILKEGRIPMQGTTAIFDLNDNVDKKVLADVAQQPHTKALDKAISQVHTMLQKVLAPFSPAIMEGKYKGFTSGTEAYGLNIKVGNLNIGEKGNYILINPWASAQSWEKEASITLRITEPDLIATYIAEQIFATQVHELAHQQAWEHNVDFASALTRYLGRTAGVAPKAIRMIQKALLGENTTETIQPEMPVIVKEYGDGWVQYKFEGEFYEAYSQGKAPQTADLVNDLVNKQGLSRKRFEPRQVSGLNYHRIIRDGHRIAAATQSGGTDLFSRISTGSTKSGLPTGDSAGSGGTKPGAQPERSPTSGEGEAGNSPRSAERATLRQRIRTARKELERLQELRYTPRDPSAAAIRAQEYKWLPKALDVEPPQRSWLRRQLTEALDSVHSLMDQSAPVRRTRAGQVLVEGLDQAEVFAKAARGKFEERIVNVYRRMHDPDIRWLMKTDEFGYSNIRKLIDRVGTRENVDAPNERVRAYAQLMHDVDDFTTSEAVRLGVLRELPSGSLERLRRSMQDRLPRMLVPDAWKAIDDKSGALYDAIVEAAKRDNPGLTFKQIEDELQQSYARGAIRHTGILEKSRKIKKLPDEVQVHGQRVAILHTEPYMLATRSIERQARRLGFIEQFGQGVLRNVGLDQLSALAGLFKVTPKRTKAAIIEDLKDKGVSPAWFTGKNNKQIAQMAKAHDVRTRPSREDYVDAIMNIAPSDIKGVRMKQALKSIAQSIRGVQTTAEPGELLIQLKERVKEDVQDRLIARLRQLHRKEGGDVGDFDNLIRVWQGLPYHWMAGPIWRTTKFVSDVIGAGQTSGSVAPNVPQPLSLVPSYAGTARFLEATRRVITSRDITRSQLSALGAFTHSVWILHAESGYSLERLGGNIRKFVADATGLRWVAENNTLIAGEAFRLMADDWKTHGLKAGEIELAKKLGMSGRDLDEIQSGQMSDMTYKKVIQNGIARTQFMTEAPHRKGKIENIPILRVLFAYSSYTMGQTRAVRDLIVDLRANLRNPKTAPAVVGRLFKFLAGGIGAGTLSVLFREALKGQLWKEGDDDKDEWWDKVAGGLWEVQIMGATHRMIDPFKYDGGVAERALVGFVPQAAAVVSLLEASLGYGRWGEFNAGKRFGEAALKHAPIVRGLWDTIEQSAFPSITRYKATRQAVSSFSRDVLDRDTNVGETQINPEYWPVFVATQRGLYEEAAKATGGFLRDRIQAGEDPRDSLRGLRSSLTARSPINLNDELKVMFLVHHASQEKRRDYLRSHVEYMNIVNAIAPLTGSESEGGPDESLRQRKSPGLRTLGRQGS